MTKKIHVYNITVSTGEQFKNVRIEGSISNRYSGIATTFISVENEAGQTWRMRRITNKKIMNITGY